MSRFICIEGVDAAGKTSVSSALAQQLNAAYYKSPGNPFADFRHHVDGQIDPLTRYFFYRAAVQHDSKVIAQQLEQGPVICDRYIYSTLAFHIVLDARVEKISDFTGLLIPDLTVVLTTNREARVQRLAGRGRMTTLEMDLDFQDRVDQVFRSMGHPVIDTSELAVEQTTAIILEMLRR